MGPNITKVLQPTPLAIWKGPESFVSKNLACESKAPVSFKLNFPAKFTTEFSLIFSIVSHLS